MLPTEGEREAIFGAQRIDEIANVIDFGRGCPTLDLATLAVDRLQCERRMWRWLGLGYSDAGVWG